MRAAVITIVAAVFVAVAVYWTQSTSGEPTRSGGPVAAQSPSAPAVQAMAARDAPRGRAPPASESNYYERFLASHDLWAFAQEMHGMALAGDDAAQYWLFRALLRCGSFYDGAFWAGARSAQQPELSVDEAVRRENEKPRIGASEVHRLHEQCARLRSVDAGAFGEARYWLRKASDSGYPLAQVWMARDLLENPGDGAQAVNRARDLTIAALRSGDADVIRQAESVATLLVQGESARERHQWVWTIAGCMRGAGCGPEADWVRAVCAQDRHCQPHEGGLDIVRRQTGPQYAELAELARELNQKIDAQEWDELGF